MPLDESMLLLPISLGNSAYRTADSSREAAEFVSPEPALSEVEGA